MVQILSHSQKISQPIDFKTSNSKSLATFSIYYEPLPQVKLGGGHANSNIQKVGVLMPKFDQFPK